MGARPSGNTNAGMPTEDTNTTYKISSLDEPQGSEHPQTTYSPEKQGHDIQQAFSPVETIAVRKR